MLSFALGIGTQNTQGDWLEVYYPAPLLNPDASLVKAERERPWCAACFAELP